MVHRYESISFVILIDKTTTTIICASKVTARLSFFGLSHDRIPDISQIAGGLGLKMT